MEKCNDCWMKEFKDIKNRPLSCACCELDYLTSKLGKEILEIPVLKILIEMMLKLNPWFG